MAIGIVAKLTIQEGKNEEFEAIFKEMMADVRANEPGNNYYDLHRARSSDTTYYVMEQYVDQAAVDAHGKSDRFKELSKSLGPFMGGRPEIELLDAVE